MSQWLFHRRTTYPESLQVPLGGRNDLVTHLTTRKQLETHRPGRNHSNKNNKSHWNERLLEWCDDVNPVKHYCVVCRWKWREWVQPLFWCLTCDILMPTLWYKDAHFFNLWYTDDYYVLEVPNYVTYWLIMPTQKTLDITNLQCRTW